MRAVTLDSPDTAPALREDLPAPTPADNEVLVRVHASSVNPVDNSIAAVAGAAPLAGITAMMAVDALALSEGDVVLVAGATGGVGSLAVQLAARAGARILAPALPEAESFLGDLGVSEVLPRDGGVAQLVRERHPDGVDALLDLVNYTPGTYDAALKEGARVASSTGAAGEGPGRAMVMAAPTTENLQRLGALLADGTLRVPVQATYELAQAPEALTALTGTHTQGKLAIRVR
jgi:NADPH:quinone reductase